MNKLRRSEFIKIGFSAMAAGFVSKAWSAETNLGRQRKSKERL